MAGGLGLALWRGGAPERIFAGTILAVLAATLAVQGNWPVRALQVQLMVGDAALLIAAAALLVWRPGSRWLVWACAIQLVSLLSHVPKIIDPGLRIWGYATLEALWGYTLMAVFTWGTVAGGRVTYGR